MAWSAMPRRNCLETGPCMLPKTGLAPTVLRDAWRKSLGAAAWEYCVKAAPDRGTASWPIIRDEDAMLPNCSGAELWGGARSWGWRIGNSKNSGSQR